MASITYHVVLPFIRERETGELVAEDGQEAPDAHSAVARARGMLGRKAGAIAFSRTYDPQSGGVGDSVILQSLGELPANQKAFIDKIGRPTIVEARSIECRLTTLLNAAGSSIEESGSSFKGIAPVSDAVISQVPPLIGIQLDALCDEALGSDDCWLDVGSGASTASGYGFRMAMLDRLVQGHSVAAIVSDFLNLTSERVADAVSVFGLSEIDVGPGGSLSDGIRLLPAIAVPPSEQREIFLNISSGGQRQRMGAPYAATAIVLSAPRRTVLTTEKPSAQSMIDRGTSAFETVRSVVRACALAGAPGTALVGSYVYVHHPAVGTGHSSFSGAFHRLNPNIHVAPQTVQLEAVEKAYLALKAFASSETRFLNTAIDRFQRSHHSSHDLADKALNLGLAAEVLLLRDKGAGKKDRGDNQEIRYKIGVRTAWYLGVDRDARRELFDRMRKLYDLRSSAAHKGEVDEKHLQFIQASYPTVMKLIQKLLENGNFPDWNSVVLG